MRALPSLDSHTTSDRSAFLSDEPIKTAEGDKLDRASFARRAVSILGRMAADQDSSVAAIIGPWGSGKTSLLGLMEEEFTKAGAWKVVSFNPWELSSLTGMLNEFFRVLATALPKKKRVRKALARYAERVAPYTSLLATIGINPSEAVSALGKDLRGDQSVERLRSTLEYLLMADPSNIVVFVDDVDRLHGDELAMLFKLVRLVGRLPRVRYVLAYDEESVLQILASTDVGAGEPSRGLAYLDKIVQVRLDVPPVSRFRVNAMVNESFERLMSAFNSGASEADWGRFSSVYHDHLAPLLSQPRSLKRYFSQIEAVYPLLVDEVNFVDFALVTFLRVFYPVLHRTLHLHKAELTGTELTFGRTETSEQRLKRWSDRLVEDEHLRPPDAGTAMAVLSALFPALSGGGGRSATGAASRCVSSAEYFDRYFYLHVPPDDFPDEWVAAAIKEALAGKGHAAQDRLLGSLDSAAEVICDKLYRYWPQSGAEARALVPFAAMVHGCAPEAGFFGRSRSLSAAWLWNLLRGLDAEDESIFGAMKSAMPVADIADVLIGHDRLGARQDGSEGDALPVLRRQVVEALKATLEAELALPPGERSSTLRHLYRWSALSGDEEPALWVTESLDRGDWLMPDLVAWFVKIATFDGGGQKLTDLDVSLLDRLVGIERVLQAFAPDPSPTPIDWYGSTDLTFEERRRRAHDQLANMRARGEGKD